MTTFSVSWGLFLIFLFLVSFFFFFGCCYNLTLNTKLKTLFLGFLPACLLRQTRRWRHLDTFALLCPPPSSCPVEKVILFSMSCLLLSIYFFCSVMFKHFLPITLERASCVLSEAFFLFLRWCVARCWGMFSSFSGGCISCSPLLFSEVDSCSEISEFC